MTIHRIGKNPKAAPSRPALRAWPAGIEYAKTATTRETTSETSAAFQAVIRATPSRTNSVSRGSMATSAVRASDPARASRTGRYMGHLVFGRNGVVLVASPRGSPWLGADLAQTQRLSRGRPRIEASSASTVWASAIRPPRRPSAPRLRERRPSAPRLREQRPSAPRLREQRPTDEAAASSAAVAGRTFAVLPSGAGRGRRRVVIPAEPSSPGGSGRYAGIIGSPFIWSDQRDGLTLVVEFPDVEGFRKMTW